MKDIIKNIAIIIKKYFNQLRLINNGITDALVNLAQLLNEIAVIYSEQPIDIQKNLRSLVSEMFIRLESCNATQPWNKNIANFHNITTFLNHSLSKRQRSNYVSRKPSKKKRHSGCSISTLSTYAFQLIPAYNYALEQNKLFEKLDINDLRLFTDRFPSSMGTLIRLLLFLQKNGIKLSVTDFDDPSLHPSRTRKLLSFPDLDLNSILMQLNDNEVIAILLGLATLRESEIARISFDNVTSKSTLPGISIIGKGEKERFIPLAYFPLLAKMLLDNVDNGNSFLSRLSNKRYSARGMAYFIKKAFKKLDLSLNPQFLRHITIMMLSLLGVPLAYIKAIAGHSDEKTTIQDYNHIQAYQAYHTLHSSKLYSDLFDCKPEELSIAEAASMLGVGLRNVQYLCKKGKIGAVKKNGDWTIREVDILEYKLYKDVTQQIPK